MIYAPLPFDLVQCPKLGTGTAKKHPYEASQKWEGEIGKVQRTAAVGREPGFILLPKRHF